MRFFHFLVFGIMLAFDSSVGGEIRPLDQTLSPYLGEYNLPALAAAVFKDGVIVAAGAVGTRRFGQENPVTIVDRFHLGSDSKAFTAVLLGQLVEAGKLKWDTALAEIYPELKPQMDPDFAQITIEQLLSHTSGLSDKKIGDLLARSYQQEGNMDEVRYWMLKETADKPLDHPRGGKFDYCNLGYVFAGAVIERLTKQTWEEVAEQHIFQPFGFTTAGFGPQSSIGKVDAPLGHLLVDGKPKGMLAGPNGDNPVILGPAGTIHMSAIEFGKWVAWNAGEGRRPPQLVSAETLKKLHTPIVDTGVRKDAPPGTPKTGKYGMGWGQVKFDWAAEPVITHTGSNGMNLAVAMFWPKVDFGFVMLTNISGSAGDAAMSKLAAELYKDFSGVAQE
jgi:CubicO group peptidase (beta-lactamase class C family)